MKRALFIDRDGTLILEPPDEQIDSLEKLEFYPGVFHGLGKIARQLDYELVMITNQDGLGTDRFPESTFWPAHQKMMRALEGEGIKFSEVLIDRSFPHENRPTRKPGTGLLISYLTGDYDLSQSYVIGDRITDIQLAKNIGAKGILINNGSLEATLQKAGLEGDCSKITTSWDDIYRVVLGERLAYVKRTTKETDIHVAINLDGSGQSKVATGLGFFDHMLDQIAKHGQIDLQISVKGDLHIDEHHTIEDTALALGEAFGKALGNKIGLERYGFLLPMDDCLAQVAIDFGGRPWLVWEADFKREKIGEMPTEMFYHFFKSFTDTARCNLNIQAQGSNEHHKIEAIFKGFAKAIRQAIKRNDSNQLPSTKGTL
jgi:imidazoleglycerol-phosphate dehydratase / histidinol-phosphatase